MEYWQVRDRSAASDLSTEAWSTRAYGHMRVTSRQISILLLCIHGFSFDAVSEWQTADLLPI